MSDILRLKQPSSRSIVSIRIPAHVRVTAGSIKSAASVVALSANDWMASIFMLVLGSAMQAYANETIEAVLVALLLLFTGLSVVRLAFAGRKPEKRAFLLTYAVCVFVGGLAQCYSLAVFNVIQSTVDAPKFLWLISLPPGYQTTIVDLSAINAPLAVDIWQQVYKLTEWLGFQFGPYIGVMFNALMMGFVGSLTVQIARELFGDSDWRLRRVGTLVASCGMFILFGAVLIRDCFTTLVSTLILLGIIRWLVQPTRRRLLAAAVLTGISALAMEYLRSEAVLMFALYWILAFSVWLFQRLDAARLVVAVIVMITLVVASSYLAVYMQSIWETQNQGITSYSNLTSRESSDDSLGVRLIINQPLPIRLVLGTGVMMINPIPLWNNFEIGFRDYSWIKGYHGLYQVLVMPLFFTGILAALRLIRKDWKQASPLVFLTLYLLLNMVSVLSTSMEQRHLGQFMSAVLIIAALPDTREKRTRYELTKISELWYIGVVLVHLLWWVLKVLA